MSISNNLPLTVCIINYNGEKYLPDTLDAIFTQEEKFNELIIIDNASADKSVELIKDKSPEIRLICLNENLGPAAARNEGYKAASNERILFVDNDVNISSCLSINLSNALKHNTNAAVAVPAVFFESNKKKLQYYGADCHFLGLMILYDNDEDFNRFENKIKKIDSLVTACFMVDKKKWGSGKPFDDSFFFNYEDHDFGLRTRIKGKEILSVSSAFCFHKDGTKGLSRRKGGEYSAMRVYSLIRNRWLIILKNYQLKTLILLSPSFFIYEIFQLLGVIKKGWFAQWIKAVFFILINFNQIIKKRIAVQKSRIVYDKEILKGGPIPFFKDLPRTRLEQKGKDFLDNLTGIYWKMIKGFI